MSLLSLMHQLAVEPFQEFSFMRRALVAFIITEK